MTRNKILKLIVKTKLHGVRDALFWEGLIIEGKTIPEIMNQIR